MAAPFGSRVLVKQNPYDERGTVAKPDNMKVMWLEGKYLGLSDVIPHGHLVYVDGERKMFIHTAHVRARLHDPGPPVEELEVSLIPRRVRGKSPAVPPAVVVAQSQVDNVQATDPLHRACNVIASMATTWGTTPKIRGAYGYPGDMLVYGCDPEGQWITQLLVATMVQAFPDSRFATVDLQDQYDGGTLVRRTTNCGEQVYVLPLVMPEGGGHMWVELGDGDYVTGEIGYRTDLEGQVHVGCVHQLRRGVPFAFDLRRWHCVTEWRKRRAVLVAYSSGVEKTLSQEDRKKLEAAGFPIFSVEEGYYPHVNMMSLVPEEMDRVHEGAQDSVDPSKVEDARNAVEPFLDEADDVVNLKFGELWMALEEGELLEVEVMYSWPVQTWTSMSACSKRR